MTFMPAAFSGLNLAGKAFSKNSLGVFVSIISSPLILKHFTQVGY
jgi:hypothetical protein